MKLLDLFCGAGGASMGYYKAGFEVVGVDINPQPNYPFEFIQADALEFPLDGFDAVHASPPCQRFSKMNVVHKKEHPDLIGPTREKIKHMPYVIENVLGAPLKDPIVMCGSMVGLKELKRHRLLECSFEVTQLSCDHKNQLPTIGVYGKTGNGANRGRPKKYGYSNLKEDWERAMGIDWMTTRELAQAIPPAYTEYIGGFLKWFLY